VMGRERGQVRGVGKTVMQLAETTTTAASARRQEGPRKG
jgi:hypothetical protein